jgi:hypothetical protein
MRGRTRGALALGLAALLAGGGCASWQQTRREVVDPIHALLHHRYADAISEMDPGALAPLFVEGARPEAMAPTLELLAGFAGIEQTRVGIDRVDLEAEPVVAWLDLVAEGTAPDGSLRAVRQSKQVTLLRQADGWRISGDRPGALFEVPAPRAYFVDETTLRGLWFRHETRRVPDPNGEPQRFIYGSGVAASDVNGDGWTDAILLAGDRIELFLNEGGYFRKASREWGLGASLDRVLTIALPFDLDNDGRRDLFVGAEGGPSLLFRNEGDRFRELPDTGIATPERTISAAAADFDGDGFADLYLANHDDVYWNAPDPPGRARNARPDQLLLNNRDGSFRDVTEAAGVANRGWSLAPVAADYDLDGDVDLFVGNDFGLDVLYRNDGHARFEEVSREAGVDQPVAAMSADWGDFDGDGDLDLFVAGMRSGSGWVLEVRLLDLMFRPYVREAIRSWFRGNRFYENLGDGRFREFAAESGAQDSGWGWATVWLDFDNDGRLDLYGANGFLSGKLEDDV